MGGCLILRNCKQDACCIITGYRKVADDFRATKKAADGSRTRLSGLGSQRTTDVLQPHNKYILRRLKGFFNHNFQLQHAYAVSF